MQVSALIAFLGGVFTLFAPCAAMLLPSFFAYAFSSTRILLARTVVFAAGVILALLPFGAFAGSFGVFLRTNSTIFSVTAGSLVLILGIMQIFSLALPLPAFVSSLMKHTTSAPLTTSTAPPSETKSANSAPSALAVFLLGLGYALAGVGCSGPILGAVLTYGSLSGSVFGGIILMVWYGLGMAFPVAFLAVLWDSLGGNQRAWLRPHPLKIFGRWTTVLNVVSGMIFVVLGLILMVFNGHVGLPSVLSGKQQIQLESSVAGAFAAVPGWLFLALVGVILALVVLKFKSSK